MGFFIKLLAFLAALFSFLVSVIDLLERFGIDLTGLLVSLPGAVSALFDGYSRWVDDVSTEPEALEMSRSLSDAVPMAGPGVNITALAISAGIAAFALLIVLITINRMRSR